MDPDTYTTTQAAKVLDLTDRHIRILLNSGELSGAKDAGGTWRIDQASVHARLERQRQEQTAYMIGRDSGDDPERVRHLEVEIADLSYRLGKAEARAELTAETDSTIREQLERERQRADEERERAERLQAELDQARLPWYRRWFGS